MWKLRGQRNVLWRLLPIVEFMFRLGGRGWNHFYGWMLDRQEERNTIGAILKRSEMIYIIGQDKGLYDLSRGVHHADYLFRNGLCPTHRILDLGCGFGRTGIPLIKRMNKGRYVGVEISAERIRIAREWTSIERLDHFCPQWIVAFDNTLPYLSDGVFDYVWAQSVLTHMPENEIRILLPAIRRVLKPDGKMLFNFTLSPDGMSHRTSVKDYQYPAAFMSNLCNSFGFRVEISDDWQDDLPRHSRALHNMMLKLTKRDA